MARRRSGPPEITAVELNAIQANLRDIVYESSLIEGLRRGRQESEMATNPRIETAAAQGETHLDRLNATIARYVAMLRPGFTYFYMQPVYLPGQSRVGEHEFRIVDPSGDRYATIRLGAEYFERTDARSIAERCLRCFDEVMAPTEAVQLQDAIARIERDVLVYLHHEVRVRRKDIFVDHLNISGDGSQMMVVTNTSGEMLYNRCIMIERVTFGRVRLEEIVNEIIAGYDLQDPANRLAHARVEVPAVPQVERRIVLPEGMLD